jgi:hypothetical protein
MLLCNRSLPLVERSDWELRFSDWALQSIGFAKPYTQDDSNSIPLADIRTFAEGDYTAALRVTSCAKLLSGRQQMIYAKYFLCGLEIMPKYILIAFAIGAGLIGLIAASFSLPGLLRHGFRRPVSSPSESGTPTTLE